MPHPLTTAFYEMPEFASRWHSYRGSGGVVVPPPARFAEIGEQVIRFLGPIRESILAKDPFKRHWPAGGPWQPRSDAGENREGDA